MDMVGEDVIPIICIFLAKRTLIKMVGLAEDKNKDYGHYNIF